MEAQKQINRLCSYIFGRYIKNDHDKKYNLRIRRLNVGIKLFLSVILVIMGLIVVLRKGIFQVIPVRSLNYVNIVKIMI